MNIIRMVFLALAVLLPATWTMAQAGDEAPAPAGEAAPKKAKKTKKAKKAEGEEGTKTEKKAE